MTLLTSEDEVISHTNNTIKTTRLILGADHHHHQCKKNLYAPKICLVVFISNRRRLGDRTNKEIFLTFSFFIFSVNTDLRKHMKDFLHYNVCYNLNVIS